MLIFVAEKENLTEMAFRVSFHFRDSISAELTFWMCKNFYDVRAFGAVMTTEVNCGQVRGPVQLTTARSINPVVSTEFSITRCAVTNKKDAENKDREMGRKFTVPYGLYRAFGYINPTLAERTGFDESDLKLFKDALNMMFENDRSAARGLMRPVRCIAFRHDSKLGSARADQLFARVNVELRDEVKADKQPPRSNGDYRITIEDDLPKGVTMEEWV